MNQIMENCQELPICSKCISKEVSGWVNENQQELSRESKVRIREELRGISLREGECIVCGDGKVTEGIIGEVIEILRENGENTEIIDNFAKSFCYYR